MRPQVSGFVDNNDANHAIIEKENFVGCFYYITVNTLHLHLYYSYTFTTLHMCMYIHCTCDFLCNCYNNLKPFVFDAFLLCYLKATA